MFSAIVAVGKNYEIGKKNQLLWHISDDLKNFKKITTGKTVIMGRKTFESIGKPLPNRRNIILSRTLDKVEGAEVFHSLDEVISLFGKSNEEVFIIGGADIYSEMFDSFQKLYVSFIKNEDTEADAFFPKINFSDWKIMEEKDYEAWSFKILEKIQ